MAAKPAKKPKRATKNALDADLRGYLDTNADIVTVIDKPVGMSDIGTLSAQSEGPILFENILGYPDFRLTDMHVKHRWSQCRALGVAEDAYLPTLAQRLRKPPRGFVDIKSGLKLPVPIHSEDETHPLVTAMTVVKDPQTGFYNTCHAATQVTGPQEGLISFVTPHTHIVMQKYLARGEKEMPIAYVFGLPPAYEIMANFSGLHMDLRGELEMVGTLMDQDVEMVRVRVLT